jgi:hypothetical protein
VYTEPGVVYQVTGSDPYALDADNAGRGFEQLGPVSLVAVRIEGGWAQPTVFDRPDVVQAVSFSYR